MQQSAALVHAAPATRHVEPTELAAHTPRSHCALQHSLAAPQGAPERKQLEGTPFPQCIALDANANSNAKDQPDRCEEGSFTTNTPERLYP